MRGVLKAPRTRAFFSGLHCVTSRSPYYSYCLRARSLCNLTEKCSKERAAIWPCPVDLAWVAGVGGNGVSGCVGDMGGRVLAAEGLMEKCALVDCFLCW